MKTIEIYHDRAKTLALVGGLLLLIVFKFRTLLSTIIHGAANRIELAFGLFVVIFGCICLYIAKRAFDKAPICTITKDGIRERSYGMLAWKDLKSIQIKKTSNVGSVVIFKPINSRQYYGTLKSQFGFRTIDVALDCMQQDSVDQLKKFLIECNIPVPIEDKIGFLNKDSIQTKCAQLDR